jgi:hypothetical protein
VEDLVQVVSSQEKELADKSLLVADLQKQLANSGNFLLPLESLVPLHWLTNSVISSAMQMLPS